MNRLHIVVGSRIRFLRKQSGLTITQLAEMAGIDGGFINCIENGKKAPSLRTLGRIAEALNVSVADIFTDRVFNTENIFDYQVSSQVKFILNGKPPEEKEKFLAILKTLKNKDILAAIFEILHKKNRSRRLIEAE